MIETHDMSVVYRRPDGSYVVDDGTFHVPNDEEYGALWAEVDAYVQDHPEVIGEEPEYGIFDDEAAPAGDEQRVTDLEDAAVELAEYAASLEERIAELEARING